MEMVLELGEGLCPISRGTDVSHTITPTSDAVYFPTCRAAFGLDRPFLTDALWYGSLGRSILVSEQAARSLEKAYYCMLQ